MLLPKLSTMDLQNALSNIIIFHRALFLIKALTLYPEKCSSGPMIMEATSLTMFPTILEKLA